MFSEMRAAIQSAQRNISYAFHHDAITGTSREHVIVDFGLRIADAFRSATSVIQQCFFLLTSLPPEEGEIQEER